MARCNDCNSISTMIFVDQGDGKCSKCCGSGLGDALDQFSGNLVGEKSECLKCGGSGDCPTCNGTGVVDDD